MYMNYEGKNCWHDFKGDIRKKLQRMDSRLMPSVFRERQGSDYGNEEKTQNNVRFVLSF